MNISPTGIINIPGRLGPTGAQPHLCTYKPQHAAQIGFTAEQRVAEGCGVRAVDPIAIGGQFSRSGRIGDYCVVRGIHQGKPYPADVDIWKGRLATGVQNDHQVFHIGLRQTDHRFIHRYRNLPEAIAITGLYGAWQGKVFPRDLQTVPSKEEHPQIAALLFDQNPVDQRVKFLL